MLFTNERLSCFAKDPAVVKFGGSYFMYYSVRYPDKRIGIGIARSSDMEEWEDIGEIPILYDYEKNGIAAPGAIVLGGRIHLFYQTYGNDVKDAICHATSDDGINFDRNETNPIFSPTTDWCCGRAIDADVCIFGGKLMLYYATRDHEMKIQQVGGACAALDSDFSREAWTQLKNAPLLVPEATWEGECIEAPATIARGGKLFMFYGGSYNCTPQQIGCAVSDDGINFEKLAEPFVKCGNEGDWNSSESGHPYVFSDDDGKIYLFYQGSNDMGKTWYLSKMEIGFDENNVPFKYKEF